ncbi:MAG: glycosyltransferase family 2 protein [Phycisphaerales bacterium]
MPKRPPTITVLFPVYNAERFVDDAIRSILEQTFSDFEMLIIDDGSTDRSPELIERHAARDGRIRFFTRENRGLVATLNQMIELAESPLLARMDADDIAVRDRFALQVRHLGPRPELVCLGGGVELIRHDGKPLISPAPIVGNDRVQAAALAGRTPLSHPAVMMRAEAVHTVGGYHSEAYPAEDLDLFLRLGEIGELDNLPHRVLRYRMHEGSISVTRSDEQVRMMRRACESAWKRRGIRGRFDAEVETKPACPIRANPTATALARTAEWEASQG